MKKYNLRDKGHAQHQTYALGIKEVTYYQCLLDLASWETLAYCVCILTSGIIT